MGIALVSGVADSDAILRTVDDAERASGARFVEHGMRPALLGDAGRAVSQLVEDGAFRAQPAAQAAAHAYVGIDRMQRLSLPANRSDRAVLRACPAAYALVCNGIRRHANLRKPVTSSVRYRLRRAWRPSVISCR